MSLAKGLRTGLSGYIVSNKPVEAKTAPAPAPEPEVVEISSDVVEDVVDAKPSKKKAK